MLIKTAYDLTAWSNFFFAEVGAAAALTGLIFVAVSINLGQIVASPQLVSRASKALVTLTGALIASSLCLVPNHNIRLLGLELLILGTLLWITVTIAQRSTSHNNPYITTFTFIAHTVLSQLCTLPYILGGLSLLTLWGGGLYWLLAAVLFSFITALLDAWVLLIEIQR